MFAARYFLARFFPPRYFPEVGGVTQTQAAYLEDFLEIPAVDRWVEIPADDRWVEIDR